MPQGTRLVRSHLFRGPAQGRHAGGMIRRRIIIDTDPGIGRCRRDSAWHWRRRRNWRSSALSPSREICRWRRPSAMRAGSANWPGALKSRFMPAAHGRCCARSRLPSIFTAKPRRDRLLLPEPTMALQTQHGVDFLIETLRVAETGTITVCASGAVDQYRDGACQGAGGCRQDRRTRHHGRGLLRTRQCDAGRRIQYPCRSACRGDCPRQRHPDHDDPARRHPPAADHRAAARCAARARQSLRPGRRRAAHLLRKKTPAQVRHARHRTP